MEKDVVDLKSEYLIDVGRLSYFVEIVIFSKKILYLTYFGINIIFSNGIVHMKNE